MRGTHADGVHRFPRRPVRRPALRAAPVRPAAGRRSRGRSRATRRRTAPPPRSRRTARPSRSCCPRAHRPRAGLPCTSTWKPRPRRLRAGDRLGARRLVPERLERRPRHDAHRLRPRRRRLRLVNYRLGVDGFGHFPYAPDNRGSLDQARRWSGGATTSRPSAATPTGDDLRESAGAFGITALTAMPARARPLPSGHRPERSRPPRAAPAVAQKITAALARAARRRADRAPPSPTSPDRHAAHRARRARPRGRQGPPTPAKWGEVAANLMLFEPVVDGTSLPGRPYDVIAAGEGADVEAAHRTTDEEYALFLYPVLDQLDEARVRGMMAAFGAVDGAYDSYAAPSSGRPGSVAPATCSSRRSPTGSSSGCRPCASSRPALRSEALVRLPVRLALPRMGGVLGACHALEIPFVLTPRGPGVDVARRHRAPQALADDMHAAWVAFVRDGDPGWAPYGDARRSAASRPRRRHRRGGPRPRRARAWPQR